jgi:hypothetical protein
MSSLTPLQLVLVIAVLALPIVPNLWAIWHIFRHDFATQAEKKGWIFLNVFLPVFGGIIYFFIGRRRTIDPSTISCEDDTIQKS